MQATASVQGDDMRCYVLNVVILRYQTGRQREIMTTCVIHMPASLRAVDAIRLAMRVARCYDNRAVNGRRLPRDINSRRAVREYRGTCYYRR